MRYSLAPINRRSVRVDFLCPPISIHFFIPENAVHGPTVVKTLSAEGEYIYLEDCAGTVHLKLVVVTVEVFDQVLNHTLGLNGNPVAFLL